MNTVNIVQNLSRGTTFLSIVVYRSHHNIALLSETLLMLSGQTCSDFEVIIVETAPEPPENSATRALLESFSLLPREKTHLVLSTGKTRAEALNHALDHAQGRMISFIKEGDLPFDNWVECLRETSQNGRFIAQAYAIEQIWEFDTTKSMGELFRSVGKLDSSSCHPFSIADSIAKPEFQGTGYAFPTQSSEGSSLRFDETLHILECWDYLLRALEIYPLAIFSQPASLARTWRRPINANIRSTIWDKASSLLDESSISEKACRDERNRIIEQLSMSKPRIEILYDPYAPNLKESEYLSRQAFAHRCSVTCHSVDNKNDFSISPDIMNQAAWTLRFTVEKYSTQLDRIDFTFEKMRGCLTLSTFVCMIEDNYGNEHQFDLASCEHNGLQIDCSHAIFLTDHPTLTITFPKPLTANYIHIKIEGRLGVEDEHIEQFTQGKTALWLGRTKRWISRRINRL